MSRGDGGHLGQRGRAMTIHHEAQDFIVRPEPALVLLATTETPRLVPLPPLGFPPTTTVSPPPELTTAVTTAMVTTARTLALPDLSSNVPLALDQLVAAALGSLPLWFLLGWLRSYFILYTIFCPHGRRAVGPGDQLLGVLAAVGALLPLLPVQAAVGQPRHHQGRGGPGSPRPGRRPRRGVPGD